ncbi:MAG: DUF1493 family protein [Planctomycetes bacterium]|jgi:hypothetical protein|nr:DUF1493 family protein [Planctomycetota bacterium]
MDALKRNVIQFVAEQSGVPTGRIDVSTTLLGDLRMDGDDGSDFLAAFAERFEVDMSACHVEQHFGPEGLPLWWPWSWLVRCLRRGTPEQKAGLRPIRVADLVASAHAKRWIVQGQVTRAPQHRAPCFNKENARWPSANSTRTTPMR